MNTEDKIVLAYLNPEKQYKLKAFLQTVLFFFENNPALKGIVHSVKSRVKDVNTFKRLLRKRSATEKLRYSCWCNHRKNTIIRLSNRRRFQK